jgi:hypothetical protein
MIGSNILCSIDRLINLLYLEAAQTTSQLARAEILSDINNMNDLGCGHVEPGSTWTEEELDGVLGVVLRRDARLRK